MDQPELIKTLTKKLSSKKTQNYTYLVVFFLIFSFFIFFAIRPSLITAVSLSKEEGDLKKINTSYESTITKIVQVQSDLQENQDKLHLITEALPEKPGLNKILQDIQETAKKNSVQVKKLNIESITLSKSNSSGVRRAEINLEISSNFDDLSSFLKNLNNQRRIKTIKRIDIGKAAAASSSASLNTIIKITSYYL